MAYVAGFIDGEGNIGVSYFKSTGTYYLHITVPQTHRKPLEVLLETFGGNIWNRPIPKNPKHKQQWYWRVTRKLAASVLNELLPYLVLKKEQAELGIVFQARIGQPSIRLPEGEHEKRAKIIQELKYLNNKEDGNA